MAEIPSVDEAFGDDSLPDADDLFGPEPSMLQRADKAAQDSVRRVLKAFGSGAAEGFGTEPVATPATVFSPETDKALRDSGLWNDYQKGQHGWAATLNEGVMRPAAAALVLGQRALTALTEGVGAAVDEAASQAGVEHLHAAEAMADPGLLMAFPIPAMRPTAVQMEARAARAVETAPIAADEVVAARAKGVVGEGEAGHFEAVPVSPEHAVARAEAAKETSVTPHPAEPPPDMHTLARRVDPEVVEQYEGAIATAAEKRAELGRLSREREAAGGVNDTPTMAKVRKELKDASARVDELVPEVAAAYRQAGEMIPRITAAEEGQVIEAGATRPAEAPEFNPTAEIARLYREGDEKASAKIRARNAIPDHIRTTEQLDAYYAAKKEAEEAAAPAAKAPSGKPVGYGNLKPVEGTGDVLTRKLAAGVEAKAVEDGLVERFGDLPEYRQLSMAEQAEMAGKLLGEEYDRAVEVAMGRKQPPKGLLPESVFVAVEKRALAEGDVDLMRRLATESKLPTAATTMGQRIRTLAERDPESPVGHIQDVQAAREASLAKTNKTAVEDTVNEIRTEMERAAPTAVEWDDFIKAITCEGE